MGLLQGLLGVPEDGIMGLITQAAVASAKPEALINDYSALRLDYYRDLPT